MKDRFCETIYEHRGYIWPVLLVDGQCPPDFHNVPISAYAIFDTEEEARDFIKECNKELEYIKV